MKINELHITTANLDDMNKLFIDAWKKAEKEVVAEATYETIYFTEIGTLLKILSKKRLELLRKLQANPGISIYELAKQLHRQYKNVYDDVMLLKRNALIEDKDGLLVPYTKIHAEISLAA